MEARVARPDDGRLKPIDSLPNLPALLALLARTNHEDDTEHHHRADHRAHTRALQHAEHATTFLPGEEYGFGSQRGQLGNLLIGYWTKSFIWISGIKIEKAMKPTAPPRMTMMSGSMRLVIAVTRVSTWLS